MRTNCINKNVEIVSMPKIASGLDNMIWKKIHEMIMNVFRSSDIEIRIYTLTQHQYSRESVGEPPETDLLNSQEERQSESFDP